jgi:KipI family sensor histidine kinase inhibitor
MREPVTWRYVALGEAALLAEAEAELVLANRYILALSVALDAQPPPGVSMCIPALTSLLLRFDPLRTSHLMIEQHVRTLVEHLEPVPEVPTRIVTIPVVYGGEAGPDLPEVASRLNLTPEEIVATHCGQIYYVLMIGFAPGFPYIGPLPDVLALPRRSTPRTAVPAGSVAIAARLTGIYPQRLPGGWHLLGRTALSLFDPTLVPPSTLRAGDGVQFVPLPEGIVP